MNQKTRVFNVLLLIGLFLLTVHQASPQSFRIPNSGDACNVVNLKFGGDETADNERGPQGPQGKRGIPGIMGIKGEKGSRGEAGPVGNTPLIDVANITNAVMKALGASSCDELMKVHGIRESGYYLMRSNHSTHPVYTCCDFQLREGIESCSQLRTLLREMKTGYFLINNADNGENIFTLCYKVPPKDCGSVVRKDAIKPMEMGGVFDVFPVSEDERVRVYCDLETDGGGWTLFQRRMDGSVDFARNWTDYVNGFGTPDGEFWLGLENLHKIISTGDHELRIDLADWSGKTAYAKYRTFAIGSSSDNYRLDVGSFTGTAGDSLAYHDEMQFTTKNADHDRDSNNCAQSEQGGWWHKTCWNANLNGEYLRGPGSSSAYGVVWYHWKNNWNYLKSAEMKLRKKG